MSRIHQALKRAEQERAENSVIEVPLDLEADPTLGTPIPSVNLVDPASILLPSTSAAPSESERHRPPMPEAPSHSEHPRIDDLRARCTPVEWNMDAGSNVFSDPSGTVPGAEQFRTLRSRLYQVRKEQPLKTVLITSSVPGEGKTFITTNLAHAIIRQPDRHVLVIDADMRRSRVHTVLGASASPGLSDYLNGSIDETSAIQKGSTGNLYLIPSGSLITNPSELLLNGRIKRLIDRLAPAFDWIIIDSPPCLPVADANTLADVCDGVLLVVRAASTQSETAHRACQELQTKKLIGVVLNGSDDASHYGSYDYYDTSIETEK
jgi:protein-tyrosine kinase